MLVQASFSFFVAGTGPIARDNIYALEIQISSVRKSQRNGLDLDLLKQGFMSQSRITVHFLYKKVFDNFD